MARNRSGKGRSVSGRSRKTEDLDSQSGVFSPRSSGWESLGTPEKKKKGTGRVSARRGRKSTGRVRSVQRRPSGHQLIPVVCSECFEELAFDTGVQTDSLTCPICEHSASRPDDATLHRIEGLRKAERQNLLITLGLTTAGMVGLGGWGLVQLNAANATDGTLFWGPIGMALLCGLVLMVFLFKYEGNRWEVYF